jgi:hypothetical protein
VGLWNVIRGRSDSTAPNLDSLFALPGAAITLQTSIDLNPTGVGSVCYRAAEGAAAAATQSEAVSLIEADNGPKVETSVDSFGFTWLVVRSTPDDVSGLVTDLHAVNSGLETQGFSSGLLCSMVAFADASGRRAALVYLYKQGTFYPFAPTGPSTRDGLFERQLRDLLSSDLRIEPDIARWMPVWGAPGL